MPNHVTTRCIVTGEESEIKRFCDTFFSKDQNGEFCVDFNRVIPMPEILINTVEGSVSSTGVLLLRIAYGITNAEQELSKPWETQIRENLSMPEEPLPDVAKKYLEKNPEYEKEGTLRLLALAETGFQSWYPWAIENWGTKWNAYDCVLDFQTEKYVEFCLNTAWSFPEPVFLRLAELFPELTFECDCYDEGANFAGEGCFNPRKNDKDFQIVVATPAIFERVYGYPCVPDEDDVSVDSTDTSQK